MGANTSSLSAQSQPNSTLQNCLNSYFVSSDLTFPQASNYMSAVNTYNTAFTIYPAAVVRPNSTEGVSAAVKCAVDAAVKVQARGGGHSFADYCIGGESGSLVIDMVQFKQYSIDNSTWLATVGAGTLLGDLTDLMAADGRAMAHGVCPKVGIGGHATIGGLGPTSRQYGAALDHIVEVEVVLANGTITRANENTQSDLFWAVRGAASSFGVVTEFIVKTEEAPGSVVEYSYDIALGSPAKMAGIFKNWQAFISNPQLDRKFASQVTLTEVAMIVSGTYFGTEAEFEATGFAAAMGSTGSVTVFDDWLGAAAQWAEKEFLAVVSGIPAAFYSKSLNFGYDSLMSNETIDALFEYIDKASKGTLIWTVIFDLEGGAVNDTPMNATAYGHRDTLYYIQTYGIGLTGLSNTTVNFLQGINNNITAAMPDVTFGAYAGYVDPKLGDDAQQAYFGSNLPRLEQIKAALDPTELFWNPQSIKPASS